MWGNGLGRWRRDGPANCTGRTGADSRSKLLVVDRFLLRIEQTNPGRGHLVEQLLGKFGVLARLKVPEVSRLAIGGIVDYIGIAFEQRRGQQAIMVRRLFLRRDSQPDMIWVKNF